MLKYTLYTNIQNFDASQFQRVIKAKSPNFKNHIRNFSRSDVVLWSTPVFKHFLIFSVLNFLVFFRKRIYYYDIVMSPHNTRYKEWFKFYIKIVLLRVCSKVFTVHKDPDYTRFLHIQNKEMYVGFKCNNYERINNYAEVSAKQYVLACGQSYRDYNLFNKATVNIDVPCKVILPPNKNLHYHGSKLPSKFNNNIEIFYHIDNKRETWDLKLLNASIVVIPLTEDCIQPAGISVYLEAMAFKKPVIITRGTSSNFLLTHNYNACIVDPGNDSELEYYINKLYYDTSFYNYIALNGYYYAMQMGGIKRLSYDISNKILHDLNN